MIMLFREQGITTVLVPTDLFMTVWTIVLSITGPLESRSFFYMIISTKRWRSFEKMVKHVTEQGRS